MSSEEQAAAQNQQQENPEGFQKYEHEKKDEREYYQNNIVSSSAKVCFIISTILLIVSLIIMIVHLVLPEWFEWKLKQNDTQCSIKGSLLTFEDKSYSMNCMDRLGGKSYEDLTDDNDCDDDHEDSYFCNAVSDFDDGGYYYIILEVIAMLSLIGWSIAVGFSCRNQRSQGFYGATCYFTFCCSVITVALHLVAFIFWIVLAETYYHEDCEITMLEVINECYDKDDDQWSCHGTKCPLIGVNISLVIVILISILAFITWGIAYCQYIKMVGTQREKTAEIEKRERAERVQEEQENERRIQEARQRSQVQ